jgi:ParB family chromosome partitioning protein
MSKKAGLPDFVKFKHDNHFVEEISSRTRTPVIRNMPLEKIVTNISQPRKDFGDITELAESIKEKGILEPILVRPKNGKYEIIAGERRYRAAKMAGLTEVPCIEYDIPDNEALEISIIENVQRKDLNIFETAYSLKSLADIYGYTHQEIAQKIGKSRVTVTEMIRVSDLPIDVCKRCLELNINSKTFILELVKLGDIDQMLSVLSNYKEQPFSRELIKEHRRNTRDLSEEMAQITKPLRSFKFNFVSSDNAVKINFNIKSQEFKKDELIEILSQLINDIKADKIKELQAGVIE